MAEIDLGIEDLEQFKVVGSGGFATVYAAWDVTFRRWVAVKVLDSLDDGGHRRFVREQGLMGQFDDHVHIVTPYRSGYTAIGAPYLVMEYLRGGSLQDRIDNDGPMPVNEAVGYVLPIARALGRAHSDGVLHRDVKPANILLTSDDVPKLTDFGIATIREATATQVAFTLAHSPPETFGSGLDARDERADLYSLASTLFTLVVGQAPFDLGLSIGPRPDGSNDSQLAYMRRIESDQIPGTGHDDLDGFVRRAMAKSPDDRYATASHFTAALLDVNGDGINTVSGQRQIEAGPESGQNRGLSPNQPASETTQRDSGPRRVPLARGHPVGLTPLHMWLKLGAAVALVAAAAIGLFVVRERSADVTSPTLTPELATTSTSPPIEFRGIFTGHSNWVLSLLALSDDRLASAGADRTIQIWNTRDGRGQVVLTGHEGSIESLAELPDGRLVSASEDDTVRLWDPARGGPATVIYTRHEDAVTSLTITADGRVVSGSDDQTVHVWDPDNPQTQPIIYRGHTGAVESVAMLGDGRIASASADGTVQIWNPDDSAEQPIVYGGHDGAVVSATILRDGRVASAGTDNTVRIWEPLSPGEDEIVLAGHTDWTVGIAETTDGRLVSASFDTTIRIWDLMDLSAEPQILRGHTDNIRAVIALPAGRIASASFDTTVRIWDPGGAGEG